MEDFLKENKIDSVFCLVQEEIFFGWREVESIDYKMPMVLSYPSKAKGASGEEIEWSKDAGRNIVSASDYEKYIQLYSKNNSTEILSAYKEEAFNQVWQIENPDTRKDLGRFIYKMSELLNGGKNFTIFGRGFKIMLPQLDVISIEVTSDGLVKTK